MQKNVIAIYKSRDSVPSFNKKKKVAAYARVSTNTEEQLSSFNLQVRYYKALYVDKENYEFVGVYADEGISGTRVAKREQFIKLIEDCRSGLIDEIITKSVSRFGRNTIDTLNYTRELRNMGIDVYFEKENIHSIDASGELMLTLVASLAQSEALNTSDIVKWGLRRCYEAGKVESLNLSKFYGYRKNGPDIEIIEEEAEVVRWIYQTFLDGDTPEHIASILTKSKIPPRLGGEQWPPTSVRKILRNEKYKGDVLFQKKFVADPLEHKRVTNKGELPQYYAEDCFPVIVSKELWELVSLEIIRREKDAGSRRQVVNDIQTFTGTIYCPVCKRAYHQLVGKSRHNKGIRYWKCCSYLNKRWVEIDGVMFTPKSKILTRTTTDRRMLNHYNRRLKPPVPRIMLCTDIKLEDSMMKKIFIGLWNDMVVALEKVKEQLKTVNGDVLLEYRSKDLIELLQKGPLTDFDGKVYNRVIYKVYPYYDGRLEFVFLAGIKKTIYR